MILGITGGTGCGKTTLLNIIAQHGGMILDCDAIYHRLLETDENLLTAIEARFPGTVQNGALRRKELGAIVFGDSAALLDLNAITHGAVKQAVLRELETKPKLAAIDAIGLFEGGLAELCDMTVAVIADPEARIARLTARDGISEEYAASRIAAQHNNQWFAAHCDACLENNADTETFSRVCLAFLQERGIINRALDI